MNFQVDKLPLLLNLLNRAKLHAVNRQDEKQAKYLAHVVRRNSEAYHNQYTRIL